MLSNVAKKECAGSKGQSGSQAGQSLNFSAKQILEKRVNLKDKKGVICFTAYDSILTIIDQA